MSDGDPRTESVRIDSYPGQLVGSDDDRELMICRYPGCAFVSPDGKALIEHINQEHPLRDIECHRCKSKTRLLGKRFCEDCVDICEPTQVSEEELAAHRAKTEAAEERSAAKQAEWKGIIQEAAQEGPEEENMVKLCRKCGAETAKGKQLCKACREGGEKKSGSQAPRKEKSRDDKVFGNVSQYVIDDAEIIAMSNVVKAFNALSDAGKAYLRGRIQ